MNWKKLFAIHILERGYDYYCDDAVENMEISDDIIRADVIGTEDYEVEGVIVVEKGVYLNLYTGKIRNQAEENKPMSRNPRTLLVRKLRCLCQSLE